MEWLSAAQCLQLGKQRFDAESYILAMRFFALGHIMDRNNEQLLNGFRASASSYTHQLWISNLAQQYPVYHGVQRVVNQNARVFYQPGMSAFMNEEFEVARLYFGEALTWDATNAHLLECFRASVELEYQRAQRMMRQREQRAI
ncbi:uncharacterized protein LOC133742871 [Rosa rugosa]|uniref:uncharacterized protein LOC133742871 n=1 Tax=Rosa rugosa TaxID=74645 RepID=UPI002B40A9DB|nr:uncharacterized protein LOC133742871 [Rosa rugosa]